MTIGQAYTDVLTPRAQEALNDGCNVFIEQCFEALKTITGPQDIEDTILGLALPERYTYKYTAQFLQQFVVCVITVAWKLAQPTHLRLSSVAEELAAWAMVSQSIAQLEYEEEENAREESEDSLDLFIKVYFEDLDFLFLFEDEYDGIDETEVAPMLGMFSLTFDDWLKPFSDEPEWIAHPYVV